MAKIEDVLLCFTGAKCDICRFVWIASYYKDCSELECPKCHNMTNFELISLDKLNEEINFKKLDT